MRMNEVRADVTRCPLCGGQSSPVFRVGECAVLDCSACGHRFAGLPLDDGHVQRVYGDDYFDGGGAGYPDYLSAAELLRAQGRRYGQLVARYRRPGRVLDVGAAAGFVLQGFADCGWQPHGIEPNPTMAAYAQQRLGLDVRCGPAESLPPGDDRFDLVSMIQVVAHFADPMQAWTRLAAATAPDGYWLIETWDFRSWTARLTGRHWHEYSPPSVLHWWSRASLAAAVGQFGFEVVATGRPQKRLLGSHAKSLLRHKFGSTILRGPLELVLRAVPDAVQLRYPAEDLFWMLCRRRQPAGGR